VAQEILREVTIAGPISPEDEQLWERVAAWNGPASDLSSLTTERLAQLTKAEGLEFATALLYERLQRAPAGTTFFQEPCPQAASDASLPDLVGIVPGAFYREHRNTGADGARMLSIAHDLGCQAERVAVGDLGGLDENARVILDWLDSHPHRRIVLVSLSKGGADVKHALGSPDAASAFANVTAWINISGMVHGTPLVGWLRRRPLRWWAVRLLLWWRGHSAGPLEELCHRSNASLAGWPQIPAHLRLLHVYGIPLRRHLAHPWAARAYQRLSVFGPNDGGGILLGDLPRLPGVVCPVWGADHYLAPAWDLDAFLRRIVGSALAPGPEFLQVSQSTTPPSKAPATRSRA
jgi:hypothetical protein